MSDSFNLNENINNIFKRLEEFIKTETVVGEPMKVGEITIVPFIDVTYGLGTGGGSGKEEKGDQGSGGGAGSGGRISPTAVLIIKGDEVELLPISKTASLEKILKTVPEIVEKLKGVNKPDEESIDKKE